MIYIGDIVKSLKSSISEHFSQLKNRSRLSETGSHNISVHDSFAKSRWDIKILDYAEGDFERKVKETIRFENLKPSLNITRGF